MGIPTLSTIFSQVIRNVKTVSHPENTTVHKHLDARSHKGCIVIGSNPVLTTRGFRSRGQSEMIGRNFSQVADG